LANALVTAALGEDEQTRSRAAQQVRRWRDVVDGIVTGRLRIGSRSPIAETPTWVTPEVVRGGFATGHPAAGGALRPHEEALAASVGLPARRGVVFAYHLTEAGLAELLSTLDSGRYRVEVPEEAALAVVAWLTRFGHRAAALELLETIGPWSDRLRFAPVPTDVPPPELSLVWRRTAGEARRRLSDKAENPRVAAMNETLLVWNPFADDVLSLWLDTVHSDRVATVFPEGWAGRATATLAYYDGLAARHPHSSKHRRPRANLSILLGCLREQLDGSLTRRRRGLLQSVVDAMLANRGRPGTPEHAALRDAQRAQGELPTHRALASVVAARVATLPQDRGLISAVESLGPVTKQEAVAHALPLGATLPKPLRKVVTHAQAGTLDELVAAGLVPSAEVLATFAPRIAAAAVAAAYPDAVLRVLMAEHYGAFRRRRSLLLLNFERQVRLDELPWIQALAAVRAGGDADSGVALRRLAGLAVATFPATLLPNPLVRELGVLAREGGLDLPWVEELAADIFMGGFSAKYLRAAQLAATLLDGTLYCRYYGIDADELAAINDVTKSGNAHRSAAFDELCRRRADNRDLSWWGGRVAAAGMVIEQAQILTTHNLALLAGPLGVVPERGWAAAAHACVDAIVRLVEHVQHVRRPLPTIKDCAYAWRQMIFHLSLESPADQEAVLAALRDKLAAASTTAQQRLEPAIAGLKHVLDGGSFDADGVGGGGRRLLGWTVDAHWMVGDR
jgi:hypothetical protein